MHCLGSQTLCGLPFVPGIALALSVAACGGGGQGPGVSNGMAAVNQVPIAQGTATLNWTPVTQNADGTPATDLAGYEIYYGTSASAMNTTVVLSDSSLTTYVARNLSSGTWYFAVAAYTSGGADGVRSNVASKTVN